MKSQDKLLKKKITTPDCMQSCLDTRKTVTLREIQDGFERRQTRQAALYAAECSATALLEHSDSDDIWSVDSRDLRKELLYYVHNIEKERADVVDEMNELEDVLRENDIYV